MTEADSAAPATENEDYNTMEFDQLIDHIVSTHHGYLKRELPLIAELTQKVSKAHESKDARVLKIDSVFRRLAAELEPHLQKEEEVLFPFILKLSEKEKLSTGSIANPIAAMEYDHDSAGAALKKLRELTDDYTEPEWACNTYRVLLERLQQLEWDIHQHVHKENNILFPKAIALEIQND